LKVKKDITVGSKSFGIKINFHERGVKGNNEIIINFRE